MKIRNWLIVVISMTFVIILAACQTSTPTNISPTEVVPATTVPEQVSPEQIQAYPETDQAIPEQVQAYPEPDQAYPPPENIQLVYNPYPGPSEGVSDYILWSQVEALILGGEVKEVYQAQTLHVTLVLGDGKIILVLEPKIDAVFEIVDRCGDLCKDVIRAKE